MTSYQPLVLLRQRALENYVKNGQWNDEKSWVKPITYKTRDPSNIYINARAERWSLFSNKSGRLYVRVVLNHFSDDSSIKKSLQCHSRMEISALSSTTRRHSFSRQNLLGRDTQVRSPECDFGRFSYSIGNGVLAIIRDLNQFRLFTSFCLLKGGTLNQIKYQEQTQSINRLC